MKKIYACIFMLIFELFFVCDYVIGETVVNFTIDEVYVVDPKIYCEKDMVSIPFDSDCWTLVLSGWQYDNETIYMNMPISISLLSETEGISCLPEVWYESFDQNTTGKRRISYILLCDKSIYVSAKDAIKKINTLSFIITIEQADAIDPKYSNEFTIRFVPHLDKYTDLSHCLTIEYSLEEVDIEKYMEENPNIRYYANQLCSDKKLSCWILSYRGDLPKEWTCIFAYQSKSKTSRIVYFNSNDFLSVAEIRNLVLLVGYTGEKPDQNSIMFEIERLNPYILFSPEPYLVNTSVGGPFCKAEIIVVQKDSVE